LSQQKSRIALILAAGKGKRMNSDLPKALHKLNGRYMIDYVIDSARKAGIHRQILVVGHQAEQVRQALARKVEFVLQADQLGTGHAVMMAETLLAGFRGDLVVLCGDMPLVKPETIAKLLEKRSQINAAAVVLTAILDDPGSYGRIVRGRGGYVKAIVEYRDADESIKSIKEVNTGAYCFDWSELRPLLGRLEDNNDQKEYYLTDTVALMVGDGKRVGAATVSEPSEGMGINSIQQLRKIEKIMKNGT